MGLPWIRVDADMFSHPKIAHLILDKRDRLIVRHLSAMLWTGRHGTGGHIPIAALPVIQATRKDAADLTCARLWDPDPDGDGWRIHDWDDYNLGQAAIEARREQARNAALKRWQK